MDTQTRQIIEEILDDLAVLYHKVEENHFRIDRSAMHFIFDLEDVATHEERDQLYHYYHLKTQGYER